MKDQLALPKLIITGDGSHTLRVDALNETYHSQHGAIRESLHVFIRSGMEHCEKQDLHILEVGFGTGLNALLTLLNMDDRTIHYATVEPYPLLPEMVSKLNYAHPLYSGGGSETTTLFHALHTAPWDAPVLVTPRFTLEKHHTPIQAFETDQFFDLVYYDAFSPNVQPELWQPAIWAKLYGMMTEGATLVTYCSKGQVRRDMESAGFRAERLPGPPGKREILRAKRSERK